MLPAIQHCVYNAPLALDPTLTRTNGLDPALARSRGKQHVIDCREHFVGPMPVSDFLSRFLPIPERDDRTRPPPSKNAFNAVPSHAETVADIRDTLLRDLSTRAKNKSRCPRFVFDVPSTRVSRQERLGYMKPHICCYAVDNHKTILGLDQPSRVEFGYVELFIDIHPNPVQDFFTDPPPDSDDATRASHDFLTSSDDADVCDELDRNLGQHISYAVEVFARQFRTFLFSIAIAGSRARLLRWDRSGCVVTQSFDIREQPELLCEFLWRFSQTSDAGRGHDLTVQSVESGEETQFGDAIREHVHAQLGCEGDELEKAVTQHYQPGRVFAVQVLHHRFSADVENIRRFIISRPVVSPSSLVGRGTRGYWALDAITRKVVFLKDTWRHYPLTDVEGDTVRRLSDLGVRYVPALVWHGDAHKHFPDEPRRLKRNETQSTETDVLVLESWVCRHVGEQEVNASPRRHYRIVTSPVGYSLRNIRGAEELLYATHDVYTAMRDALAKDSLIHRDISIGNIVLVKETSSPIRRGYLIDWEASCNLNDSGEAEESGRAGTWQFMSFRMLDNTLGNNSKQKFQDDMESLLYVILYCSLLWQPHNFNQKILTATISRVFDFSVNLGGVLVGGSGKLMNLQSRSYTRDLVLGSKALQEFLETMMDYHAPLPPDVEALKDKWSNPEHLDAYWTSFLQTHALEPANRVVHTLDVSKYYDPRSFPTESWEKSPPASAPGKRRVLEEEHEATSTVKRARSPVGPASLANPSGISAPKSTPTPALRRSRRIQERQRKQEGESSGTKKVKGHRGPAERGKGSRRGHRGTSTRG